MVLEAGETAGFLSVIVVGGGMRIESCLGLVVRRQRWIVVMGSWGFLLTRINLSNINFLL